MGSTEFASMTALIRWVGESTQARNTASYYSGGETRVAILANSSSAHLLRLLPDFIRMPKQISHSIHLSVTNPCMRWPTMGQPGAACVP
jgi:hypothetical protein